MKTESIYYKALLSSAAHCDWQASTTLNPAYARLYAERAAEYRAQAEALPDDFVDPEQHIPEWGTYGT